MCVAHCAMLPPMSHSDTRSDLVGSAEICTRAEINRTTLCRHVAMGKITPAVRVGTARNGAMLFDRAAADAYISAIRADKAA